MHLALRQNVCAIDGLRVICLNAVRTLHGMPPRVTELSVHCGVSKAQVKVCAKIAHAAVHNPPLPYRSRVGGGRRGVDVEPASASTVCSDQCVARRGGQEPQGRHCSEQAVRRPAPRRRTTCDLHKLRIRVYTSASQLQAWPSTMQSVLAKRHRLKNSSNSVNVF